MTCYDSSPGNIGSFKTIMTVICIVLDVKGTGLVDSWAQVPKVSAPEGNSSCHPGWSYGSWFQSHWLPTAYLLGGLILLPSSSQPYTSLRNSFCHFLLSGDQVTLSCFSLCSWQREMGGCGPHRRKATQYLGRLIGRRVLGKTGDQNSKDSSYGCMKPSRNIKILNYPSCSVRSCALDQKEFFSENLEIE